MSRMPPTKIILDCDPGHDDAIALLLALASPEVELVGVTTVSGNQTVEKTTANALRLLEFLGRGEVPVARGAERPLVRPVRVADHVHGESGLDGPDLPQAHGAPVEEHAVEFLARTVAGATLVATGPLTNVALLLAAHPDSKPDAIVLMGGAIGEGNITPAAEFNIWADPEAARRVFESGVPTTMVGLDVTHRALITPEHNERLRGSGRAGKLTAELVDFYFRFHAEVYPELGGSPMHDPVALAHVIDPGFLELADAYIEVDCAWEAGRGRTNVDFRGREGSGAPNAKVATGIDGDRFLALLVDRIARLG
jgi:inosine-uridine nucleoside N-ribohydrolase